MSVNDTEKKIAVEDKKENNSTKELIKLLRNASCVQLMRHDGNWRAYDCSEAITVTVYMEHFDLEYNVDVVTWYSKALHTKIMDGKIKYDDNLVILLHALHQPTNHKFREQVLNEWLTAWQHPVIEYAVQFGIHLCKMCARPILKKWFDGQGVCVGCFKVMKRIRLEEESKRRIERTKQSEILEKDLINHESRPRYLRGTPIAMGEVIEIDRTRTVITRCHVCGVLQAFHRIYDPQKRICPGKCERSLIKKKELDGPVYRP